MPTALGKRKAKARLSRRLVPAAETQAFPAGRSSLLPFLMAEGNTKKSVSPVLASPGNGSSQGTEHTRCTDAVLRLLETFCSQT